MADPALQIEALTIRRGVRVVVDQVSFAAPAAALTVLLGPNGAGKSTVLKAAVGLLPHEGRIRVAGVDVASLDRASRARAVTYVPQHSALDAPLSVREVIRQGRFAHGAGGLFSGRRREHEPAVESALARTDLLGLQDRPFTALSYGERRRVLVARALATEAKVLLLDEPTAALDVAHALALLDVLRAVARAGAAVVVVLHQLQEAAAVADQVVLMADGRCVQTGPADQVIAADPIRAVYGVELVPRAQFACRLGEPRR